MFQFANNCLLQIKFKKKKKKINIFFVYTSFVYYFNIVQYICNLSFLLKLIGSKVTSLFFDWKSDKGNVEMPMKISVKHCKPIFFSPLHWMISRSSRTEHIFQQFFFLNLPKINDRFSFGEKHQWTKRKHLKSIFQFIFVVVWFNEG